MAAVLFDTHQAVKDLQDAGVDPAAAESIVRTVQRGLGGNVSTKRDIAELRAELKGDIAGNRAEMHAEFKTLYKHLWIMGASIIGLTVTLTKVLS